MEKNKFIRRLDEFGRLTLPASLRKQFKIEKGCYLETVIDGNRLIMRKSERVCIFCNNTAQYSYLEHEICEICIENISTIKKS